MRTKKCSQRNALGTFDKISLVHDCEVIDDAD